MAAQIDQQQVEKARTDGVELVGPGGVLTGLTKSVSESALETEMSEHVGYDKHDPAGRNHGNSRNGTRTKTVVTEIGPARSRCLATGTARSSHGWCASGSGDSRWLIP